MSTLASRFDTNPILRPSEVKPSRPDMKIECLLNPGAFRYQNRIGLLLRVAERPVQEDGWVSVPIVDPTSEGGLRIFRCRADDPKLDFSDARVFTYDGKQYLTTLSHLRLAWSTDGRHFVADDKPTLTGQNALQSFGLEDSRVAFIDGRYYLTYTEVSEAGVGVGMTSTADWMQFHHHGMIIPPHNKDCALFEERIDGHYYALHRPSGVGLGGNFIWTARSPDLLHWGDHRCIARTRRNAWDSGRVGAGASPIKTSAGWLAIYHGADDKPRYSLGLLLLDLKDPTKVIARSTKPIMEPEAAYELTGFFGNVVFTNGHVIDGDTVTVYYGASDEVICGATLSIQTLLATLA